MTNLLVMKERVKIIYGKYEIYITPFLKFALALVSLLAINQNIGYMYRLKNPAIVLVVALLCSFLPINLIIIFGALFVILHLYALSMECAIVVLVLFLLMFLLYFRFSPRDTLAVLLTPICFALHIPYVVPLAAGFIGTPLSAISVSGGVIVYYVLNYIKLNSSTLGNLEADSVVQKFKYVVDGILNNKAMLVMVIAFSVTVVVVYFIRRLSTDYSWRMATIAGVITNVIIILFGDFFMDLNVSIIGTILGNLISILLIMILQFFVFSVDYSRTEFVQFEDDEYYYYVKAIPKMMIATPEKKIKRINPQKQTQEKIQDRVINPDRVIRKRGLDEDFDIR